MGLESEAYGTAKSGVGIASMGVMRPDMIMTLGRNLIFWVQVKPPQPTFVSFRVLFRAWLLRKTTHLGVSHFRFGGQALFSGLAENHPSFSPCWVALLLTHRLKGMIFRHQPLNRS